MRILSITLCLVLLATVSTASTASSLVRSLFCLPPLFSVKNKAIDYLISTNL